MFKLFDELLGLIGYAIAGILGLVLVSVGFTLYPIITSIILGLLVISPFVPTLEKMLKRLEARMYKKSLTIKLTEETKRSFKEGFNKAFK
ncbi:hypothetical protein [Haemophilus paraphrohaemolyticus]|uniref:Uncharacterized protein n=1 Tax=Haemophilus paraphrohaemolyticus HK411 TaxID=1095743 RepID=I2NLN9_9PAST|nr:hypothetical protein [Haemophilus paraphrohaemolyticus]EIG26750.1 hypothetical protein HMPREF1054_1293 [Haemophilus paraphrohaemolyticus HK411]OOR93546.1 hypothetical protein B0184_09605 [Haemophilus paraphrohaemolyticus]STP01006.1 Uncharacterised protein [Haemophilus paraphrohaemolyticus]